MTLKTTLVVTSFMLAASTSFALDIDHNTHVQISSKTYTVKVKGSKKDSQNDVLEDALYKVANKTLKADYDWFKIVNRETDSHKTIEKRSTGVRSNFETAPVRRCGLLSCKTQYRAQYGASQYDNPSRNEVTLHNVTLEYRMGRGPMDNSDNYYNAKLLKAAKK